MSLMHNIRNFAEIKLQGVIPWSKFSFPDETHTDVANVSIEGKAGLYRIVVSSSYAVPPLGKVVFKDHTSGHEIEGQNQDDTWHRIAEYLKANEANEWAPEDVAKMAAIEPKPPVINKIVPLAVSELQIPPVAFVWYLSDPGVWYQNGPALVTRVNADGSYNLTVFPNGSEPFYRESVGERSDSLKNICWIAYPDPTNKISSMEPGGPDLVRLVADGRDELAELRATVTELQDTISRIKASAFDQRKSA
jgi:hypothetical protein